MGLIQEKYFVKFWGLLGGLAALLIWYLPWRFQVNDDEVMMWLVSGAYTGSPESYAVFLHPLLSWGISLLYKFAPGVLWYPLVWFTLTYLSFLVSVAQVNKKLGATLSAQIWVLFLFAFYAHFLFFLQFSIVAGFAVFSGLIARFGNPAEQNDRYSRLYRTDLLILFGFLVRPEVLFLFLAGVTCINVLVFKRVYLYKRSVVPLLLGCIGYGISILWIANANLSHFEQLNRQRSGVFDHPTLQLNKEVFRGKNPELYFFSNGMIDFRSDAKLVEKLPIWKMELDKMRWDWIGPDAVVKSFWTYVQHEHFLLALMAVFFAFSLLVDWRKAFVIAAVLAFGMLALSPFFLIKVQIYALVFLIFMLMSFCFFSIRFHRRGAYLLFISVLVVGIAFHFYAFFHSAVNWVPVDNLKSMLDRLRQDGYEEVFLVGPSNLYSDLLFEPTPGFKVLGWPTLLEKCKGVPASLERAYLVDSATYIYNQAYFENEELLGNQSGLYLLVSKQ